MSPRVGDHGEVIDLITQHWVKATGVRRDLSTLPWLNAPTGAANRIGNDWISGHAEALGGHSFDAPRSPNGLLPTFGVLDGGTFDPTKVAAAIVGFYEGTSLWQLNASVRWNPAVLPFGWLISRIFAQRLDQFALPLTSADIRDGLANDVRQVHDVDGHWQGTAWVRTSRATGLTVYSGWYDTVTLPRSDQPSLRVSFPLPNGALVVLLRPMNLPDGGLRLNSPDGKPGQDGAYLVVRDRQSSLGWVRRVPIRERFDLHALPDGSVSAQHVMDLKRVRLVELDYRLRP